MINYSETELKLILSHYLFKICGIHTFVQRLRKYLNGDYTDSDILYIESIFSIIDPANNKDKRSIDKKYIEIWDKYSSPEARKDLRVYYQQFNQGFLHFYKNSNNTASYINESTPEYLAIVDKPIDVPEFEVIDGEKKYKRNKNVVTNALRYANYTCEGQCKNILFIKRNSENFYTEAHHLIPLSFQDRFEHSLDVEANVISLCPMCHRLLHYGQDINGLLESLYNQRIERLKKCGIEITIDELLKYYIN